MARTPAKKYTTRARPYQLRRRNVPIVSDGTAPPRTQSAPAAASSAPAPTAQGQAQTEPVQTEPVQTEPVQTEPIQTEPIQTEPIQTEPIQTDPVQPDPVQTEPAQTETSIFGTPHQPQTPASRPLVDLHAPRLIPADPTFFGVPAEVRLLIYEQLMEDDEHNRSRIAMDIRLVSRQVNREVTRPAFSRTVFELAHQRWPYDPVRAINRVSHLTQLLTNDQRQAIQRIAIDGPGTVLPSLRHLHNGIIRPVEYIIEVRGNYVNRLGFTRIDQLLAAEIREVGHHTANGGRVQRVTFHFPNAHDWNQLQYPLNHFSTIAWHERYGPAQVLHERSEDRLRELQQNHRVGFRMMPRYPNEGYWEDPRGAPVWQPESVRPLEVYFSRPPRGTNGDELSDLEYWWVWNGNFNMTDMAYDGSAESGGASSSQPGSGGQQSDGGELEYSETEESIDDDLTEESNQPGSGNSEGGSIPPYDENS